MNGSPPTSLPEVSSQFLFDPHLLSASVHTLQISLLWPTDTSMQQMLAAVVEIAAAAAANDKKANADSASAAGPAVAEPLVLTAPAAVALAGCGVRMTDYLIDSAITNSANTKHGTLNVAIPSLSAIPGKDPIDLESFLGPVREAALQKLKNSGSESDSGSSSSAASTSPILHSFCQRRWQLVKEKRQSMGLSSPSDSGSSFEEVEQVLCGAFVTEWIGQLLVKMTTIAQLNQSLLLSLPMLDVAVEVNPRISSNNNDGNNNDGLIARVFQAMKCSLTPRLDAMDVTVAQDILQSLQPVSLTISRPIIIRFGVTLNEAAKLEDEVAQRILDHRQSWYHEPILLRRIADQFGSGQRLSHKSDQVLRDLRIKPLRIIRFLPLKVLDPRARAMPSTKFGVSFVVTDDNGREWPLEFSFQEERQIGSLETLADGGLATLSIKSGKPFVDARRNTTVNPEIVKEFQPRLSDQQRQTLFHLQQAVELGSRHWLNSALEDPKQQLISNDKNEPTPAATTLKGAVQTATSSANSAPITFATVKSQLDAASTDKNISTEVQTQWRLHEFERIALQVHPLVYHSRWGLSRYAMLHTEKLRRSFQSMVVDAAMTANQMRVFPQVINDLISDFHTMESLPYIPQTDF